MRLIDADALYKNLGFAEECKDCDHQYNSVFCDSSTWQVVCDAIYEAPTIDAVPVVRCKDCVYRVIMRDPLRKPMDCYGCKVMHYNEDDWFCSFGERKDDDED